MKIAIIGLGLIGGSFAKAIKKHTSHSVSGYDISPDVNNRALSDNAIDNVIADSNYSDYDIIIISLYPKDTISFLKDNYNSFNKSSIVMDLCGVKSIICNFAKEIFNEKSGATFVGGHPMAGKEHSGYAHSVSDLYRNASMILTPINDNENAVNLLTKLSISLGFKRITVTTAEHHDKVIAYTSQMAHIVSNAYMQSPSANDFKGFSAGSFADLTRVAKLNEHMWTELFLCNKDCLTKELDCLINNLVEFKELISESKENELKNKLKFGREIKEKLNDEAEME